MAEPQAVHAGVDLEVKGGGLAASAAGGALEERQLIAAMNDCGEIVLEQASFFAGHEACEDENGLANAGFAHGDAFVGAGDAKPVRACFFQRFGNLRATVAVAVAFDDGQDLARGLALFVRGIHVLPNGLEVVREGAEGNLRPDRPARFAMSLLTGFAAGTFLFTWHVPSENLSLRQPRRASRRPDWPPA